MVVNDSCSTLKTTQNDICTKDEKNVHRIQFSEEEPLEVTPD
jgi:hypothetical protein